MSDETLIRMLEEAAGKVPDSPAPVGGVIEEGRRTVRRRRNAVLGGVVVAALLVAGGVGIQQLTRGGSGATTTSATLSTPGGRTRANASSGSVSGGTASSAGSQTQTQGRGLLPAAPAGTRWVGAGRVMVAVPTTWPMRPGQVCADSQATYVTVMGLGTFGIVNCPLIPPAARGSDQLVLSRADGHAGDATGLPNSTALVCEGRLLRLCHASETVDGVVIAYTSADADAAALWRQLSGSVRPIPTGYVAVPWASSPTAGADVGRQQAALRDAGLRPALSPALSPALTSGLSAALRGITTDPEPGAVVRRGQTVAILAAPAAGGQGTLDGLLMWAGGPDGTGPKGHQGTIHITGHITGPGTGSGGEEVDEFVSTDRSGHWSYAVPGGGTFTVTGTSTGYGSTGGTQDACVAGAPVHVRPGQTVRVTVTCALR